MALRAELMELADMQDLGSCAARCEGSNPSFRITLFKKSYDFIDFCGEFPYNNSICEPIVSDEPNRLLYRWDVEGVYTIQKGSYYEVICYYSRLFLQQLTDLLAGFSHDV